MARVFDTVEQYIKYVESVSYEFVEQIMTPHILQQVFERARFWVYNPKVWKPKKYVWTYTLISLNYYKTDIKKKRNFSTSTSVIDAYIYSTSPHVEPVVNGEPYEHKFKYYGVKREFVEEAEKLLLKSDQMRILKSKAKSFYNSRGLNAY